MKCSFCEDGGYVLSPHSHTRVRGNPAALALPLGFSGFSYDVRTALLPLLGAGGGVGVYRQPETLGSAVEKAEHADDSTLSAAREAG